MLKSDSMIQRRGASQAVTFVVAASDSLHQGLADYVCGGTDDQIEIQAALDGIPTAGGKIVFIPGKYECSDTIYPLEGTTLQGIYSKAYAYDSGATLNFTSSSGIEYGTDGGSFSGGVIQYLRILGSGVSGGLAGIRLHNSSDMVRLEHTLVNNFEYGVYATNADSLHLEGMRLIGSKNNFYSDGSGHSEISIYNGYLCEAREDSILIDGAFASLSIRENEIHQTTGSNHQYYGVNINNTSSGAIINNNYFRYIGAGVKTQGIGTIITDNTFKEMYSTTNPTISILNKYVNVANNYFYHTKSKYLQTSDNGHYPSITNNVFNSQYSSTMGDVLYIGTAGSKIVNNMILYGGDGIKVNTGYRHLIHDNYIAGMNNYDITIDATVVNSLIHDNIFNSTSKVNNGADDTVKFYRNYGYITEKSGTDTIASASTSTAVTHGLSVTPTAGDIMVTPMESLGNASFFWIDTYTSTQFTIHTNVAPGADTDFAWKAIVL